MINPFLWESRIPLRVSRATLWVVSLTRNKELSILLPYFLNFIREVKFGDVNFLTALIFTFSTCPFCNSL